MWLKVRQALQSMVLQKSCMVIDEACVSVHSMWWIPELISDYDCNMHSLTLPYIVFFSLSFLPLSLSMWIPGHAQTQCMSVYGSMHCPCQHSSLSMGGGCVFVHIYILPNYWSPWEQTKEESSERSNQGKRVHKLVINSQTSTWDVFHFLFLVHLSFCCSLQPATVKLEACASKQYTMSIYWISALDLMHGSTVCTSCENYWFQCTSCFKQIVFHSKPGEVEPDMLNNIFHSQNIRCIIFADFNIVRWIY